MKRTPIIAGALTLVALALLLIVACGPDPTPTSLPDPTAPLATAPPQPTAATMQAPTRVAPAPTATPASPPSTPAPSPEEPEDADPSDAYFAMDRVLDVSIEIDPDDWDTLRHQTRTFDDLMAEIDKYQLSRPFASIYDWFPGTVTIDGETHTEVGVRKKGFLGSQSDAKPSLKLRFDKYVDGQALGGVIQRMTLNNSIQDPSMVNTCLAYQVFAAAGLPASRCNFATVTVNGKNLGLYAHVEEIKAPMLSRHFDSSEGNLYEGTISDFTPTHRGTIEKKTNEDADDWSDVDAVMSALQDPSDAGLEALAELVDLDRFLSFWATESLVGHWDGYTGHRNNYHFYREPDGKFVFIPWGVDDVFHLKGDPNPFDNISEPPPSVLALTAIPNRLYNIPEWRAKYALRMKEILDTVWSEDELLDSVDQMAAIVQEHSLPESRAAAEDTERVRKFILKRKGEILADITPEPPDWPEPDEDAASAGEVDLEDFELGFKTTWGTKENPNPLAEGTVYELDENGDLTVEAENAGATAGLSTPQEEADIGVKNAAMLSVMGLYPDGTLRGVTVWLPTERLSGGASLRIGVDPDVGGVVWEIPAGKSEPEGFIPIGGQILLIEAGTEPGAVISGVLFASFEEAPLTVSGPAGSEESDEERYAVEYHFETSWGSSENPNPLGEGAVTYARLTYPYVEIVDAEDFGGDTAVVAGQASHEEQGILLGINDEKAAISIFWLEDDGSVEGFTIVLLQSLLYDGATLSLDQDAIGGAYWLVPPGATKPDEFTLFNDLRLELTEADTEPGAAITGRVYVAIGGAPLPETQNPGGVSESADEAPATASVFINEVAAKGAPLDWFELYNVLYYPVELSNFLVADDLTDTDKRVAFPPGTEIGAREFLRFELDKDGWPGFALSSDEELGVWMPDGALADMVDWDEGQSGEGQSYARIPDGTGEFQTVSNPTPGAANQP